MRTLGPGLRKRGWVVGWNCGLRSVSCDGSSPGADESVRNGARKRSPAVAVILPRQILGETLHPPAICGLAVGTAGVTRYDG